MKQLILLSSFMLASFIGFSQENATPTIDIVSVIESCQECREVVLIGHNVEKTYTRDWLEGVTLENGYVVFSKGEQKHYWKVDKFYFVERSNSFVRIYSND